MNFAIACTAIAGISAAVRMRLPNVVSTLEVMRRRFIHTTLVMAALTALPRMAQAQRAESPADATVFVRGA
jgi:hypothetical protein